MDYGYTRYIRLRNLGFVAWVRDGEKWVMIGRNKERTDICFGEDVLKSSVLRTYYDVLLCRSMTALNRQHPKLDLRRGRYHQVLTLSGGPSRGAVVSLTLICRRSI